MISDNIDKSNATPSGRPAPKKTCLGRLLAPFTELFGLSRSAAILVFFGTLVVVGAAVFWFFSSAPPRTLSISAGPPGSGFETNAIQYRDILAKQGVRLRILPSEGSRENLKRLEDKSFRVDVGFVQGGLTNKSDKMKLVSLGSISYQPLVIFYRSPETLHLLSQLKGKRLAVGAHGSGTRSMAMTLFRLNGMETNGPNLLDLEAEDAAKALLNGSVDAAFLMGESASPAIMKQLVSADGIQLFSFSQADAYVRRITYLNKLQIPMGAVDFGKNIPTNDVYLIGPTVEILARPNLHPALVDLLLEAAQEVHGRANLMQKKKEFPAPIPQDYPISDEALRFYKSGRTFLYSLMPFWLASLVNRIILAFVPIAVILVPGLKLIPAAFKWRIRMLIYRRYRALLALEREVRPEMSQARRDELNARLDHIESSLGRIKTPASFGEQFFGLHGHINLVRSRLAEGVETT